MSNHKVQQKVDQKEHEKGRFPLYRPFVILLGGLLGLAMAGRPLYLSIQAQRGKQEQLIKVQEAYQTAQKDYQNLMDEYYLVQDPAYLADIARRDYYYTKPGEITFILKDENPQE